MRHYSSYVARGSQMKSYNQKMYWVRQYVKIPFHHKIVYVHEEDDGSLTVWHTDSPFWYDFYHADEYDFTKEEIAYTPTLNIREKVKRVTCTDPNNVAYWM